MELFEPDPLGEAYEVMRGTESGPVKNPVTEAPVVPVQDNGVFETIVDMSDLGDLIYTLREYYKSLPPEQQLAMATYFQDHLTPQEESTTLGISNQMGFPSTNGMATGMGQQMGMSTKAKILGIPPGQSPRNYPVSVNGVYKVIDRTTETVTISTDDGKKLTFPKHLVQML